MRHVQQRENASRCDRHAGIDQKGNKRRQAEQRAKLIPHAAHHPRVAGETNGDIGACRFCGHNDPRVVDRKAVRTRDEPQRRRRIRRSAAKPGCDGQPLDETERAEPRAGNALAKVPRRAQHEIIFNLSAGGSAWTLDGKSERLARCQGDRVARAGESDETLERVPPVGAPAGYMQAEIDFCWRAFGQNWRQIGRTRRRRSRLEKEELRMLARMYHRAGAFPQRRAPPNRA